MNLSPGDLRTLFGRTLFLLDDAPVSEAAKPEESAEAVVAEPVTVPKPLPIPQPFLRGGKPVVWKLKPASRLALLLRDSEFKNKELTALLKQCMVQSGIPLEVVGFGVFEDGCQHFDLEDMPTPLGILFQAFPAGHASPQEWEGHVVFEAQPLASLTQEAARQQVIFTLKQCKSLV